MQKDLGFIESGLSRALDAQKKFNFGEAHAIMKDLLENIRCLHLEFISINTDALRSYKAGIQAETEAELNDEYAAKLEAYKSKWTETYSAEAAEKAEV